MAALPVDMPDSKMLTLFGCGVVLLRGAGCTVNDLIDRDIDVKPRAYLGLTFNWGALLGCAAIRKSIDPAVFIPLYTAGICWTLVYDTIYAHQDKEDDVKVSVKSTALRFGDLTKTWISGFGLACIGSLAISGHSAELAWPFYPFLAAAAGQMGWKILTVDLSVEQIATESRGPISQYFWTYSCDSWMSTQSFWQAKQQYIIHLLKNMFHLYLKEWSQRVIVHLGSFQMQLFPVRSELPLL